MLPCCSVPDYRELRRLALAGRAVDQTVSGDLAPAEWVQVDDVGHRGEGPAASEVVGPGEAVETMWIVVESDFSGALALEDGLPARPARWTVMAAAIVGVFQKHRLPQLFLAFRSLLFPDAAEPWQRAQLLPVRVNARDRVSHE